MQHKHKYQAYATATQTMAKTKQIVLLYDGIIRFLQQAKEAIRDRRIEDRWRSLTRASEIITGLQSCLDFEKGGDIAKILYSFYSNADNRIFAIHRSNNPDACDEVIADMKRMRDVWQEIDQQTSSAPSLVTPLTETAPANPPQDGAENVTLSA